MTKTQFKIGEFKNPSGEISWRVSGSVDGKQIRKNFKTQAEAITWKQNEERRLVNLEPLPAITTRLTNEQAAEAEAIFSQIKTQPHSLSALVSFALAHYNPSRKTSTVSKAFEAFIQDKENANSKAAHIRTLKIRLKALHTQHGAALVSDIQPDQVKALIFRDGSGNVNRESDYRAHTNFFNWCKAQGYCNASPLDSISKIKIETGEPEVLTVAQCRALLTAATHYQDGALVPYVCLALFCAIRPAEVSRLTWADVDTQEKVVTISAKIAKMRARRLVSISDKAAHLLALHKLKATPIYPANWRKDFDQVKALARIEWSADVMRHTGISMHLAQHKHEGQTATWAGNSPDIIQKHYKGLVKDKDAAAFWEIEPSAEAPTPLEEAA